MYAKPLLAAAAAAFVLVLFPEQASATTLKTDDPNISVRLAGDNFAVAYDSGFYSWRSPYRGRYGRYHGRRGFNQEVIVDNRGRVKLVTLRRGRIVDVDVIGRVGPRGHWSYNRGFYGHHWRAYEDRYYRGWRDWDRRRYAYRDQRRFDDRYHHRRDRRYDRYDDRRDRRNDRYDDRRDRRDDRYDDRRHRRDDRRGTGYVQRNYDGVVRGRVVREKNDE